MSFISHQFSTAIDLRIEFALNLIFSKYGLNPDIEDYEITNEAWILGEAYPYSDGIRKIFTGSPLEEMYVSAHEEAEARQSEYEQSNGSKEEWDALSAEEQYEQWDNFHDLCTLGIADVLYFYRVMMNMHLEGYVGH